MCLHIQKSLDIIIDYVTYYNIADFIVIVKYQYLNKTNIKEETFLHLYKPPPGEYRTKLRILERQAQRS